MLDLLSLLQLFYWGGGAPLSGSIPSLDWVIRLCFDGDGEDGGNSIRLLIGGGVPPLLRHE